MCFYGWMGSGSKEWLLKWMQVARPKENRKRFRAKKRPSPTSAPAPSKAPLQRPHRPHRRSRSEVAGSPIGRPRRRRLPGIKAIVGIGIEFNRKRCFSICFSLSTVAPFKFRDQHCCLHVHLSKKKKNLAEPSAGTEFCGDVCAHEQLWPSCPPSFRPKRKKACAPLQAHRRCPCRPAAARWTG